ncbi:Diphosphomevalonate decarboxylase [Catenaria anguillulae PL171]|uniref:Diphosphomevalonate decarboxylase n=1 Tax=Catenaria anguillulae PL171 TaxID=765915 RepID=A0A1Y2HDC9_9FUNG|nr:Diphosphomevalonate decarboxylase [Catenaria anguillulae PL171]
MTANINNAAAAATDPSTLTAIEATATAPVNIAVIKYWGKRDQSLILPTNSSLSLTLSQDILHSKTSAFAAASVSGEDTLWLNGTPELVSSSTRLRKVIAALRDLRRAKEAANAALPKISQWTLRIVSENNFPTAAGLASSASGFAALVAVVAHLYDVAQDTAVLSSLARLGSGSACRSLYGGFVAWEMGCKPDGSDSVAVQVAPESHWPEIEALVLVVHDGKKGISSTSGMQTTVDTSPLAAHRFAHVVPERMEAMKRAIHTKDFDSFAELTMRDSNQFHAVCLDTFPPIFYLNDVSRAIIQLITDYNATPCPGYSGKFKVAYTYDAGPNTVLYLPRRFVPEVLALVNHYFPHSVTASTTAVDYFTDPYQIMATYPAPRPLADTIVTRVPVQAEGGIKRILHSKVGDGPRFLHRGVPGSAPAGVSLVSTQGEPLARK